jgi:hypothetical protein
MSRSAIRCSITLWAVVNKDQAQSLEAGLSEALSIPEKDFEPTPEPVECSVQTTYRKTLVKPSMGPIAARCTRPSLRRRLSRSWQTVPITGASA